MRRFLNSMTATFSAGCFGALVNSAVFWVLGFTGVIAACGVRINVSLTLEWLYPRIVWGGLWGFLFMIPVLKGSFKTRGLLFSLGPTLTQLLYFFPLNLDAGMLGIKLGTWTPALVLAVNAVWGLSTALWLKIAGFGIADSEK